MIRRLAACAAACVLLVSVGCKKEDVEKAGAAVKKAAKKLPRGAKLCFVRNKAGTRYYFDEGEVYLGKKFLGRTKKGCVRVPRELCSMGQRLSFRPDATRDYGHEIRSGGVDTCRSADVTVSKSQYRRFQRLKWAVPYVKNIALDDPHFKKAASRMTLHCRDSACRVNTLYKYVTEKLDYLEDPEGPKDSIYTPRQTMKRGGGDCEDLAAVVGSLLEGVGVRTFMVLSEEHAFALACGVSIRRLQRLVAADQRKRAGLDELKRFKLGPGQSFYYGGQKALSRRLVNLEYSLRSTQPLDVHIVESAAAFKRFEARKHFRKYPRCGAKKTRMTSNKCVVKDSGGIILLNKGRKTAVVNMDARWTLPSKRGKGGDGQMLFYRVQGEECVVLEATAGRFGYPGYFEKEKVPTMAIDPRTYEIVDLD